MGKDIETILQDEIVEFCQHWNIRELALFGSVLQEDFGASSDVDILVTFGDDSQWGLFDHVKIEAELEQLLGYLSRDIGSRLRLILGSFGFSFRAERSSSTAPSGLPWRARRTPNA